MRVREQNLGLEPNVPKEWSIAGGCAFPLEKAGLRAGETVLDLGCGEGGEVLGAARLVGHEGWVYGLDKSAESLALAAERGAVEELANVSFVEGFVEHIPLADTSVDVVISNCVINLSEDRALALAEAYRVLKHGGRLVIADIVLLNDTLTTEEQQLVAPVLGCQNGVLGRDQYLRILNGCGFAHGAMEVYLRFSADRLWSRAEKRKATGVLAALNQRDFAQRVNGAFASVYVTADRPFGCVER